MNSNEATNGSRNGQTNGQNKHTEVPASAQASVAATQAAAVAAAAGGGSAVPGSHVQQPVMGRHGSTGDQQPHFPGSINIAAPGAQFAAAALSSVPRIQLGGAAVATPVTAGSVVGPVAHQLAMVDAIAKSQAKAAAAAARASANGMPSAPPPSAGAAAAAAAAVTTTADGPKSASKPNGGQAFAAAPKAASKSAAAPAATSGNKFAKDVRMGTAAATNGNHRPSAAANDAAAATESKPPKASAASRTTQSQPMEKSAAAAMSAQRLPAEAQEAPPPAPDRPFGDMRVLRVEDALLYLDEVKRQFSGRPEVYNEFLCIMKNFKSQAVDTPGVIDRVSRLFHGYNNLILGFNKFLPDGYKISMEDLRIRDAAISAKQRLKQEAAAQSKAQAGTEEPTTAAAAAKEQQWQNANNGPGESPQVMPQKAESSHPTDMEGVTVIETSGPNGSRKEQPAPRRPMPPSQRPDDAASRSRASPTQQRPLLHQPQPYAVQSQPSPPQQQQQQQPGKPAGPQQHQAIEFDHAIAYVTTIKRRFSHDPGTYHSFLEILHTYQKEQRGIKEVLEQVAHLFQDHPDLLREFTFFLPDAVQEQAKERLHRAAADSEARQAAQREQAEQERKAQHKAMHKHHSQPPPPNQHAPPHSKQKMKQNKINAARKGKADADRRVVDMTSERAKALALENRNRKRAYEAEAQPQAIPITLPQQPETYIYNSAVERQFFDAAHEALTNFTRDGGQAWAEFLKCLDMYAQEILSRTEMLTFVEPLLGKRNTKLFEEFKKILAAAGNASAVTMNGSAQVHQPAVTEDSWHSVPLSEIDFSRCRRCSPSYRALPRDYPAPPCSDRSDDDAKVLNDIWVSLPTGSEDSYTFRHMRRNTYEESLFRCEDERFEIDMVIDSNACTLQRLEPIAEEISQLAEAEHVMDLAKSKAKPQGADKGMGGRKFQYAFDKTILGVIHRNSIARIYGDAGKEMLDLMVKNPTVAIPLVVDRLRTKDREWRVVRGKLNRFWKELARANYYRSLDHRSLTWRTTDKRAISTRTLVAEIKDRAAHGGRESKKALQDRLDKAKDEHGTFYEVTMISQLSKNLDLTHLPRPDRRLFTPHMSLMYPNDGWAQRDAYRILAFAVERGAMSPDAKERCQRMWTDFLAPWFNVSSGWMVEPTLRRDATPTDAPSVVSNDGEADGSNINKDVTMADADGKEAVAPKQRTKLNLDHHPLPTGAPVITLKGEGHVISFNESDGMYAIKLPSGVSHMRQSEVLCSVFSSSKSAFTTELRQTDRSKLGRPGDMLCIGTQNLYLFLRLHQILVRRLCIAKDLAYKVKDHKELVTLVEQVPGDDPAELGKHRYESFLGLVYALLDGGIGVTGAGNVEGNKYEDRVRALLGHGGYELATMDKLISHILKNLQTMSNDETMVNLTQLFRRHLETGCFKPDSFRQEAALLSDGDDMYAFQKCPHDDEQAILHFEYLGVISESGDDDGATSEAMSERHAPIAKRPKRER